LPQVSGTPAPGVDVLSVAPMDALEQDRQRIRPIRRDHQVDMIGHEAIGQHSSLGVGELLGKQRKIHFVIGGAEKHPLAVSSALGHVIRESWYDASCVAGHILISGAGIAKFSERDRPVWLFGRI